MATLTISVVAPTRATPYVAEFDVPDADFARTIAAYGSIYPTIADAEAEGGARATTPGEILLFVVNAWMTQVATFVREYDAQQAAKVARAAVPAPVVTLTANE